MPTGRAELLASLASASAGLLFVSETDAPFALIDAPDSNFGALTDAELRRLAGRPGSNDAMAIVEVDYFFRNSVADQSWFNPAELDAARRYRELVALIHRALPDARVYRVGTISIAVLLLGSGPGGGALGLSTLAVET